MGSFTDQEGAKLSSKNEPTKRLFFHQSDTIHPIKEMFPKGTVIRWHLMENGPEKEGEITDYTGDESGVSVLDYEDGLDGLYHPSDVYIVAVGTPDRQHWITLTTKIKEPEMIIHPDAKTHPAGTNMIIRLSSEGEHHGGRSVTVEEWRYGDKRVVFRNHTTGQMMADHFATNIIVMKVLDKTPEPDRTMVTDAGNDLNARFETTDIPKSDDETQLSYDRHPVGTVLVITGQYDGHLIGETQVVVEDWMFPIDGDKNCIIPKLELYQVRLRKDNGAPFLENGNESHKLWFLPKNVKVVKVLMLAEEASRIKVGLEMDDNDRPLEKKEGKIMNYALMPIEVVKSLDPSKVDVGYMARLIGKGLKLDNPEFNVGTFLRVCGIPTPVFGREWMRLEEGDKVVIAGKMKGKKGVPFIIIYQSDSLSVVVDLLDDDGLMLDADPNQLIDISLVATKQNGLKAYSKDITVL